MRLSKNGKDRTLLETGIVLLAYGTTFLSFSLSANLMELLGIKYSSAGGNFLHKMHPATYLAVLAFGLSFLRGKDYILKLPERFPAAAFFFVMWIAMLFYIVLVLHNPVTSIVDTFFCTFVMLIIYEDLDEDAKRTLRIMLHGLMFANAMLGIGEFAVQKRMAPQLDVDGTLLDDYRSTALLGHPLTNAATTGAYILTLFYNGDPTLGITKRIILIIPQIIAMVPFGGRTSIMMTLVMIVLGLLRGGLRILLGAKSDLRGYIGGALALPAIPVLAVVAMSTGALDKLIERFVDDNGSAKARISMLELFNRLTQNELLFGPDNDRLESLMRTLDIIYGIENSWLGLLFHYGAFISFFFLIGFFALLSEVWSRGRPYVFLLVFHFLFLATSAAGISVKTFNFNQFAMVILLVHRKTTQTEPMQAPAIHQAFGGPIKLRRAG